MSKDQKDQQSLTTCGDCCPNLDRATRFYQSVRSTLVGSRIEFDQLAREQLSPSGSYPSLAQDKWTPLGLWRAGASMPRHGPSMPLEYQLHIFYSIALQKISHLLIPDSD